MNYKVWIALVMVLAASYVLVNFQASVELGPLALFLLGVSALVMARTNNSGT